MARLLALSCLHACLLAPTAFAISEERCVDGVSCFDEPNPNLHLLQTDLSFRTASHLEMERANIQGETWVVCKSHPSQPRSPEEKAAGMDSIDEVKCTNHMDITGLCCAEYKDEDFIHHASLDLPTIQDSPSSSSSKSGGHNDPFVYRVCSQSVNGTALSHGHAVSEPITCMNKEITSSQLKGNPSDPKALQPGEIVLRERLVHLAKQQIPLAAVPTCRKMVAACPNGRTPTVVELAWVNKMFSVYQKASTGGGGKGDIALLERQREVEAQEEQTWDDAYSEGAGAAHQSGYSSSESWVS